MRYVQIYYFFSLAGPCACMCDQCDYSKSVYSGRSSDGYILPIRYRGDDEYSRARRSTGRRLNRQTPTTIEDHLENFRSFAAKASEAFANPSDAMKEGVSKLASHAQTFREHVERMVSPSEVGAHKERMEKFATALHPDNIKAHFSKMADHAEDFRQKVSKMTSSIDPSAIHESISKMTEPIVGHAQTMMKNSEGFFKGFQENFNVPVSRSRRSVDDKAEKSSDVSDSSYGSDEYENNDERRYPVLRIKDRQMPCQTIKNLQRLSETRVELRSPDSLQYVPELAIGDAVEVPKYVEYVDGEAVSYQPRKYDEVKEKASSEQKPKAGPRIVFDRYGHRYFENNGNLRLAIPQHQEAMVGAQQDFAGLPDILNQNREVMHDLNALADPTRMVPQPLELATDAIDLIRDMARRSTDYRLKSKDSKMMRLKKYYSEKNEQKAQAMNDGSTSDVKESPKSIYQLLPMNVDEHEGKLLVRVYSAKDSQKYKAEKDRKLSNESRPGPYVRKITKGDHDYEVITFDQSPDSSAEEVQQIYKLFNSDDAKKDEQKP